MRTMTNLDRIRWKVAWFIIPYRIKSALVRISNDWLDEKTAETFTRSDNV